MDDTEAPGSGAADETIRAQGFRETLLRTVRKAARQIPFAEDVVAAYYCAIDASTPLKAKAAMAGALAYFVLPADMIPDVVAGFGFTDDLAVLTAALAAIRPHVTEAHREAAGKALDDGGEG